MKKLKINKCTIEQLSDLFVHGKTIEIKKSALNEVRKRGGSEWFYLYLDWHNGTPKISDQAKGGTPVVFITEELTADISEFLNYPNCEQE